MDNLYAQFIRDKLANKHTQIRPRIRVCRQSLDLSKQGSFDDYWHHADRDLPRGLLARLVEDSRTSTDLGSQFVLDPLVDQAQATALELFGEHYSPLPLNSRAVIEFAFSPVVTMENVSLFYASFDRGFLWAAGFLCIATGSEPVLQKSHCLWRS